VEFALHGGRINTDAIDNSAGVDCSDHEVNIKILLDAIVESGDMTGKQRNELLASMTEEVGELVLRDNYEQTQALASAVVQAAPMADVHARYIRYLESTGRLNRELEALPNEETLSERRSNGGGLTAPEFAVLLAYTKLALYGNLMDSDAPEDPYLSDELERYFPVVLRERFRDRMRGHRLRRELVATQVSNGMVTGAGPHSSSAWPRRPERGRPR
jgi:glutamate dehydrogenase